MMLAETKVSKGNLTVVPKEVRNFAGVREGDVLTWEVKGDKIIVRHRRPRTLKDIIGMISHGGDAVMDKKHVQGMRHAVR